mmetsp:Transcript_48620/g.105462  ORF Transcript_48620/g.105462 Transcript_48620/m.105462 type:complete len:314 (-) Transcript_48620:122-1063(-)
MRTLRLRRQREKDKPGTKTTTTNSTTMWKLLTGTTWRSGTLTSRTDWHRTGSESMGDMVCRSHAGRRRSNATTMTTTTTSRINSKSPCSPTDASNGALHSTEQSAVAPVKGGATDTLVHAIAVRESGRWAGSLGTRANAETHSRGVRSHTASGVRTHGCVFSIARNALGNDLVCRKTPTTTTTWATTRMTLTTLSGNNPLDSTAQATSHRLQRSVTTTTTTTTESHSSVPSKGTTSRKIVVRRLSCMPADGVWGDKATTTTTTTTTTTGGGRTIETTRILKKRGSMMGKTTLRDAAHHRLFGSHSSCSLSRLG